MCRLSSSTRLLSALLSGAVCGCGILFFPSFTFFYRVWRFVIQMDRSWRGPCRGWEGKAALHLLGLFRTGLTKLLRAKLGGALGCPGVAGGGAAAIAHGHPEPWDGLCPQGKTRTAEPFRTNTTARQRTQAPRVPFPPGFFSLWPRETFSVTPCVKSSGKCRSRAGQREPILPLGAERVGGVRDTPSPRSHPCPRVRGDFTLLPARGSDHGSQDSHPAASTRGHSRNGRRTTTPSIPRVASPYWLTVRLWPLPLFTIGRNAERGRGYHPYPSRPPPRYESGRGARWRRRGGGRTGEGSRARGGVRGPPPPTPAGAVLEPRAGGEGVPEPCPPPKPPALPCCWPVRRAPPRDRRNTGAAGPGGAAR